jgi:predicted nucleotidyltransferase
MHLDTLPQTSVEILTFLSSRLRETFTVRQIARGIGKDYRITYFMTKRLAKQRYLIAEKRRPVTQCRINLKGNASLLAYIEGIRASRFFAKHRDLAVVTNDVMQRIVSPFFTLMIFGSHVKGTASAKSDLDVAFLVPDEGRMDEVSSAVGSVERISPIGIHEVTLTVEAFRKLLEEKKPNVAWEALDSRIALYGAEPLFRILEEIM